MPDLFIIDERGIQDKVEASEVDIAVRASEYREDYLSRLKGAGYTGSDVEWPREEVLSKWWWAVMF